MHTVSHSSALRTGAVTSGKPLVGTFAEADTSAHIGVLSPTGNVLVIALWYSNPLVSYAWAEVLDYAAALGQPFVILALI